MKLRLLSFSLLFLTSFFFTASCVKQNAQQQTKVCMILDKAGKDDKSFNQSAYEGLVRAEKDFHIEDASKYVIAQEDAQTQQFVQAFSSDSCGLIIAVGFNNADITGKMAPKFPKQNYVVVDASIKEPNIRSIAFQEHEGSFLVGAIAALKSKSQQIGFIGGMEIPLIKRFAMGYKAGAQFINPKIKITEAYIGVTSSAWSNPAKAKELALSMYNNGADVIFIAAGPSSQGAIDAAQEKSVGNNKKFVIGVDSNQNYLAPGIVLTSMEKKVGVEVYQAIKDYMENKFTAGVMSYGFADGGIDWSYDKYNQSLFTDADIRKISEIKQEIMEHKINVPDYYKIGAEKIQ